MLFFMTATVIPGNVIALGDFSSWLLWVDRWKITKRGEPKVVLSPGDFAGLVSKSWALGAKLGSLFMWGRSIWGTCLLVSCCSDSGLGVLEHCVFRVRWLALIEASDTLKTDTEMSVGGNTKTSDLKENKKVSFLKVAIPFWKVIRPYCRHHSAPGKDVWFQEHEEEPVMWWIFMRIDRWGWQGEPHTTSYGLGLNPRGHKTQE